MKVATGYLSILLVAILAVLPTPSLAQTCFDDRSVLDTAINEYLGSSDPDVYSHATYGPIQDWCFDSALTDFSSLFVSKTNIPANMDISQWEVKDVTDMSWMFGSSNFNGDISEWNVGKVTNFLNMFTTNAVFNQPIGGWDVSNGLNFQGMFVNTASFNQNIGGWDVSSGTNFWGMFQGTALFNQDLSCWNVGAGNNFNWMFLDASAFNQDLCPWGAGISGTPVRENMFANSGCDEQGVPDLTADPKGPFCYQCSYSPPKACTWVDPVCSGKDWCVEFDSFAGYLDADTPDVTLAYSASEPTLTAAPTDAAQATYYQVSLMSSGCVNPLPATPGLSISTIGPFYASSSKLTVGLDIDTSKIETPVASGGLATDTDDDTFTVTFCAKVDLFNDVDGVGTGGPAYKVETSETDLTLTFDKKKNFEFTITAEKETRGARTTDVTIDHDLEACVCAIGDAEPDASGSCLPTAYTLNPGDSFHFCVKDVPGQSDMTLDSLKNVVFKNVDPADPTSSLDDTLSIPIINGGGAGVGPSENNVDCSTTAGLCIVKARTYARMYEKVDATSGVITDISAGSRIGGTAVLAFNRRRRGLVGGSIVEEKELVEVNFGGSKKAPLQ